MEHITVKDNVFLLNTEKTSYMFMINAFGHPEHIHYGGRVQPGDAEALRYRHDIQYGSEIMYSDTDNTYCLDNVPLEWSGIGKGDFRITPAEILMPDMSYTSDFVFDGYEINDGCVKTSILPGAYAQDTEARTLIVHLKEKVFDLRLDMIYTVFPYENVITRRVTLENREEKPVTVRRLMSMLVDLPNLGFDMITLDGDWISETHRHDRALMPGTFVNQSTTGSSSNRHNPGVILSSHGANEEYGKVYGFNLIYSGNHYTAVELSPRGTVRVISGINPLCFSWTLNKGETFETPEAVLTYSPEGYNGMSRNFHDFVNKRIVRGEYKEKDRPVLINNWESCFFKFTRRKLIALARRARALGTELFVLDDGWFGGRNNDLAGLGDYNVNTKKLPGGIKALCKSVNSMGMSFGLWFEPESVNEDSDLYRSHPEYAVKLPSRAPSHGRHQLILDLTNPEVRDYIVKSVGGVLDSANISYVKWDMNRHMSDMFSLCCAAGEFYHRYILGLYEILGRIFKPRPHILLESCSSGGNRFDLGMLCFSPQIWCSDDTDPVERLEIQRGLSYFYPLSTMGAHVSASPHQQTLRQTPLSTRFNISAFGCLGYELDLNELTPVERKQIKEQIAFYKKHRRTLQYGEYYRVDGGDTHKYSFICAEKDKSKALLLAAQSLSKAADVNDRISAGVLDGDTEYEIESMPQKVSVSRFGGLIKHISPIRIKPNGFIMRLIDSRYALDDGKFTASVHGGAFSDGIYLNNQFLGTGYDRNLRLWGDYGSQLYIITAKKQKEKVQ